MQLFQPLPAILIFLLFYFPFPFEIFPLCYFYLMHLSHQLKKPLSSLIHRVEDIFLIHIIIICLFIIINCLLYIFLFFIIMCFFHLSYVCMYFFPSFLFNLFHNSTSILCLFKIR